MKHNLFPKTTFSLLLLLICGSIHAEDFYKETRKSINVTNKVILDLDINYADVIVQTWDQPQMEIIVKLNVIAKSEERANEIFESVLVKIVESESLVGLSVSLGNYSCSGWKNESYTVTVEVKMPDTGSIDGNVSFANINISDLKGACELHVEYGDLRANSLQSNDNDIEIAFGNATIQSCGGGEFENEYGNLEIKKLSGNAEIKSGFGDLELDYVGHQVQILQVNIEYGNAEINLATDASFNIDIQSNYSDIDLPDGVKKIKTEAQDYTSKHIVASVGSGAGGALKIECDFGNVDIDLK